ncbi:hypothetical protein [Jannaschia formosa]|uniref:hypothetical protein n=1 Tax=Jannaschia formosa TaxID=2259592 RepID=UPI0010752DE2|nr:hypothetical protein [Jannaschia formosa]TFL16577.1 hypothetical protein DR046_19465 [Jannaschia formosa]
MTGFSIDGRKASLADTTKLEVVGDEAAVAALVKMLDAAAERAEAIGPSPIVLAECPHKFNDAWYDDVWHAVQSGMTWWEQSQFFENYSPPYVEERGRFEPDTDTDGIRAVGAELAGERIAALRAVLRGLQVDGWRAAIEAAIAPSRNLCALVVEHGQRWLVLETPNVHDAEIFAWDRDGLFTVGTTERFDQAACSLEPLRFETVVRGALDRLSPDGRRYFFPEVVDEDAAVTLHRLLWNSVRQVRAATKKAASLVSRADRQSPQSYSEDLRPYEGELRKPKDGVWPPYRPSRRLPRGEDDPPLSDLAKGLHLALGPLEDARWRELYGKAFGEALGGQQTLALLVLPDRAMLIRDNAILLLEEDGLKPVGICPSWLAFRPEAAHTVFE